MQKNTNFQIDTNDTEKKRKKFLILVLIPIIALAMILGSVAAYFSDIVTAPGDVTTGTLDITGTYSFYVNGSTTPVTTIKNLNPGDVIVVKATITNIGNKSAWVRDVVSFDSLDSDVIPYISLYSGEFTHADLGPNGTDLTDYQLELNEENFAKSTNKVINGVGEGAEEETGADYEYIGSNTYEVIITIYFSHTATNEAQGKNLSFHVKTQALQFRNNNEVEPNEAAWNTVIKTSFGN